MHSRNSPFNPKVEIIHGKEVVYDPETDDYYGLEAYMAATVDKVIEEFYGSQASSDSEHWEEVIITPPDEAPAAPEAAPEAPEAPEAPPAEAAPEAPAPTPAPMEEELVQEVISMEEEPDVIIEGSMECIQFPVAFDMDTFNRRIKHHPKDVVILDEKLKGEILQSTEFHVIFKVAHWEKVLNEDKLIECFANPDVNVLKAFTVGANGWKRVKESVVVDKGMDLDSIWELVEERLQQIMSSGARERTLQFIQLYELYNSVPTDRAFKHNITSCFQAYLQGNTMKVEVTIGMQKKGGELITIGSREYSERGTLTPLGLNATLESVKRKYKRFTWKRYQKF